MATQSLPRPGDPSQTYETYGLQELQIVVRDKPVIPVEIEPFVGLPFTCSVEIFRRFGSLASLPVETFLTLHLNNKNVLTAMTTSSIGTLNASLVHPRDVFRPAIVNGSAAVVFVHNHPNGCPQPSSEDLQITRRLVEVGRLIGIRVLDHIVIGSDRYFSFADEGLI